jgi:hypothetical protein
VQVSTLLVRPPAAHTLYVLAHGAGAGMRHAFMEAFALRLAGAGVATLRYQFPYTEQGARRIDPEPLLLATVRAAVAAGVAMADGLRVVAGGKSMGGRMTSRAVAAETDDASGFASSGFAGIAGLVFTGFPLHPAGRPGVTRADHLARVPLPMLFLQGTRDALADLELLRPVLDRLGPRATLAVIDHADHAFHVLKRSGRTDDDVLEQLAATTRRWAEGLR